MNKPYKGHIENWYIFRRGEEVLVVIGTMVGATVSDTFIRTSPIVALTMNMVETQNSIYSLGGMSWPAN